MNKLVQRKYNICGALEKVIKGEKFSFADYATKEEKAKFLEYGNSFKYITGLKLGKFYNFNIQDTPQYKLEHKIWENYKTFTVDYIGSSRTVKTTGESTWNERVMPELEEEKIIENDLLNYFGNFLDLLNSDLKFCYGTGKKTMLYIFYINLDDASYWHEDLALSNTLRASFSLIGKSTLYTDVKVEEVNSEHYKILNVQNAQIYNATEYELSFHYMSVCKFSKTYKGRSVCNVEKSFEGVVHKGPELDLHNQNSLNRLFLQLPECNSECLDKLPEHLANLKQKTTEQYNIPTYEFNWENVTLYINENIFQSENLLVGYNETLVSSEI